MATVNVTPGYNWVSGEVVTPAKMNLAAAPTATATLTAGEVTTAALAAGAVTSDKIASGIDASKLTTGTLPIARIADDAVTNDKLSLAANAGEIKKALNADNAPPIYACRAWVKFDGSRDTTTAVSTANTNRLINASGNVTSVLRNAGGDYTITFTTALPSSSYCSLITVTRSNSNGTLINTGRTADELSAPNTTTLRVVTGVPDANRVLQKEDCAGVSVAVFA